MHDGQRSRLVHRRHVIGAPRMVQHRATAIDIVAQ